MDMAGVQDIDLKFSAQTSAQKVSTVVDLSGVSFISSIGIRVLLQNAKALALAGKKLVLAGARNEVAEVLRIAGITDSVECVESVAHAVDSLAV
ncbi:MAG: hypothetical protein OHK005_02080 [Candidatus Methylacidiphilales bacterium]